MPNLKQEETVNEAPQCKLSRKKNKKLNKTKNSQPAITKQNEKDNTNLLPRQQAAICFGETQFWSQKTGVYYAQAHEVEAGALTKLLLRSRGLNNGTCPSAVSPFTTTRAKMWLPITSPRTNLYGSRGELKKTATFINSAKLAAEQRPQRRGRLHCRQSILTRSEVTS